MRPEKRPAKELPASRRKKTKVAADVRRDTGGYEGCEDIPVDDKDTGLGGSCIPDMLLEIEEAGQEAKDAQVRRDLNTMKLIFHEAVRYTETEKDKDKTERFEETPVCSMLAACSAQVLSKIYALREVVTGHAGRRVMQVEDMKFCEELCNILTREE